MFFIFLITFTPNLLSTPPMLSELTLLHAHHPNLIDLQSLIPLPNDNVFISWEKDFIIHICHLHLALFSANDCLHTLILQSTSQQHLGTLQTKWQLHSHTLCPIG